MMPATENSSSRFYSPLRRGIGGRGRDAEFASPSASASARRSNRPSAVAARTPSPLRRRRSPAARTSPERSQEKPAVVEEPSLYPPMYIYATPDRKWRLIPSTPSSLGSVPSKTSSTSATHAVEEPASEVFSQGELPFDERRTTSTVDPPARNHLRPPPPVDKFSSRSPNTQVEKTTVPETSSEDPSFDQVGKPTKLKPPSPFTIRKLRRSSPNTETATTERTTTRLADLMDGDDNDTITTVTTGYRGDDDLEHVVDVNNKNTPAVEERDCTEPEDTPPHDDQPFDFKPAPTAQPRAVSDDEPAHSSVNRSALLSPYKTIGRVTPSQEDLLGDDAMLMPTHGKANRDGSLSPFVVSLSTGASSPTNVTSNRSALLSPYKSIGCVTPSQEEAVLGDDAMGMGTHGKENRDGQLSPIVITACTGGSSPTDVTSNVGTGQSASRGGGGGGEATPVASRAARGSSSTQPTLREQIIPGQSKRTDFPLHASKTALLIIDIQEFLGRPSSEEEEESYLYKTAMPGVIANLQRMVGALRAKRATMTRGCNVVFTYLEALTADHRDVSIDYRLSGRLIATGIPNSVSAPAKFLVDLQPQQSEGDILIPKTSSNVFVSTNLHYVLQNLHVEQLIIAGQLTDQCVESAVRDAADLGYLVTLVEDACAANTLDCHEKGLHGCKGFSRIVKTAQVLQELAESTDTGPLPSPTTAPVPMDETKEAATTDANEIILPAVDYDMTSTKSRPEVVEAIQTALKVAGVKFLRFTAVDPFNTIRSKVVPLSKCSWDSSITIATVCHAGLPSFADMMIPESGLDAKGVLELVPDYGTMRILPYSPKTAMILGTSVTTSSSTPALSPLCTRGLLQRLVKSAKDQHGITFNVGAELEFCLHDGKTSLPVDQSVFANNNTLNQREEFLSDVLDQLEQQAIPIELLHAESGPAQIEVVIEYSSNPVRLADQVLLARETVQACARARGYRALFLPKLHADKAGSGCHLHLSFGTSHNENAFPSRHDARSLSREGQSFLEGILQHLPALTAVTMPSTNSFRRVGKGCWTGYEVGWDVEDKEVPLRVCRDIRRRALTNVEFKLCDSMANMYVALTCVLACGLDGILRQASLRSPLSGLPVDGEEVAAQVPKTFDEALDTLADDDFLTKKVLGSELSKAYLAVRRVEAKRTASMSLEKEVAEAFEKA